MEEGGAFKHTERESGRAGKERLHFLEIRGVSRRPFLSGKATGTMNLDVPLCQQCALSVARAVGFDMTPP